MAARGGAAAAARRGALAGREQTSLLREVVAATRPQATVAGGRARTAGAKVAAVAGVLAVAALVAFLGAAHSRQMYMRGVQDGQRLAAGNGGSAPAHGVSGAAGDGILESLLPWSASALAKSAPTTVGRALELTDADLSAMAHYVYFSDEHRLILTCLPKVASSWTLKLMLRMCGENRSSWDPEIRSARVHSLATRKPHMVSHLTPEEATRRFLDPSYTRAIVVRDPLERLLSAYQDKIVGERRREKESRGWWDMNKTVNSFVMQEGRPMPTFKEFATWASSYPYPEVGGTGAMGLRVPLAYNPFSAHVFVPFAPKPTEEDRLKYRQSPGGHSWEQHCAYARRRLIGLMME